jgi:hypothetical protein
MPNKVRALHGLMMQWAMVQNLVQETPFLFAFCIHWTLHRRF